MGLDEFGEVKEPSPNINRDDISKKPNGIGEPMPAQSRSNEISRKYEYLAASQLSEKGYLVIFPPKDTTFDFLVSTNKRIYKVEVKYSNSPREASGRVYHQVRLDSTKKNSKSKPRLEYDFDYLIAYTAPTDDWYIIPAPALDSKTGLALSKEGKYGEYIDNW